MSYTEYMNRKKASAPVILNTQPKMDASTFTRHKRVTAAATYTPTKSVVGNIFDMRTSVGRDNNYVKAGVQVTVATGSGGDVPDASTYSDYAAGRAANMDYKGGPPLGKVVLNANPESVPADMKSISGCNWDSTKIGNRTFPNSTFTKPAAGVAVSPEFVVAKTGSQVTRDKVACYDQKGEPHNATGPTPVQKGVHYFVDDTLSLNSGTFRIGTGSASDPSLAANGRPGNPTGSTKGSSGGVGGDSTAGCPGANHSAPEVRIRAGWAPRPTKGAGGLFNPVVPSKEVSNRGGKPYKVGALVPSDHLKYVEKHHGNDLGVNPRRVPEPFHIPANAPAHLKINDPKPTV